MEEIDLKEILKAFYDRKILIIVVTIICTILGAIYSFYLNTPKYKATTTLVLTKTESSKDGISTTDSITQTDITLNQKLVSTYSKIIKSRSVLSTVVANLEGLNITDNLSDQEVEKIKKEIEERKNELTHKEEILKKNITVTAVEDSSVIEISVVDESPEYATQVANEIAKVFSEKIAEMYKINNIYTLDVAEIPSSPYNVNHKKYIAISAVAGVILACGYIFVANMFNNTTKNKEEIEKTVGAPVLVSLGNRKDNKRGGARE